ncbi:hypothetical protein C2845_PM07G04820 [Panicum miliaceum]|uniref:HMA domain-containing protein n=1 Tax=Panicum miliaceum TaxID=4540 RepID=A0A3L6SM46_PANMI|nr:hypothetical protein C2845_PM07G04820 [Panicum miliaceum]
MESRQLLLPCRVDFQSCRLYVQLRIGQRFCRTFSVPAAVPPPPDTQNLLPNQPRGAISSSITMSKKIVIKADLVGQKCKSEILAAVSKLQGIKSLDIDAEKCTLTVVGTVDPVCVVLRLKKKCFAASIVSVEDNKPKKKEPCKEACEKLCKENKPSPGFYCNPPVPSYPYPYGCPSSYPYYACYEERSPDGACAIQ